MTTVASTNSPLEHVERRLEVQARVAISPQRVETTSFRSSPRSVRFALLGDARWVVHVFFPDRVRITLSQVSEIPGYQAQQQRCIYGAARIKERNGSLLEQQPANRRRQNQNIKGKNREYEIIDKTKVVAAVAAGVVALTAGAMGQSQSSGGPPNEYAPTTKPSVNTHMGNRGYNNTPNAAQNEQRFSDESAPSTTQKKTTKHKGKKSSKQRTQQSQQNQGTQNNDGGY